MTDAPVVIVTGAAGGIGRVVAQELAERQWRVVATDVSGGEGVEACDVTSQSDVERLVAGVVDRHGRLDALVNSAGLGIPSPFLDATDEFWQRILDVNLMGTVRMCRAAIPAMLEHDRSDRAACIVNFTSQAAKTGGLVIGAPYSAAKAAVLCLTMTLAAEFGPRGIRVNAVAPGIIESPFLDNVPAVRDRGPTLPLGRIGRPEDVAGVVAFLLSEDAAYLTGETVDVNGGLLMD
jgi:meso-butanediol dehydrogenase / (S,S)-butanediol dehydrogenase / diacetyl reductase